MYSLKVKRGDIYYADLRTHVGHEQSGIRPVLILQDNSLKTLYPTVIVAPITSKVKDCDTHIFVRKVQSGLRDDSYIVLEQIKSIDISRLREKIWSMPSDIMAKVDEKLYICLGIQDKREGQAVANLTVKQVEFNGDSLLAVKDNDTGKVYVAVNHICNALGIDSEKQRTKLREHMTISKGTTIWGVPSKGGIQDTFVIELDFLPLWLAGINPVKVNPKIQPKLIEYQLKAKDVLASAFLGQVQPQFNIPQTLPEALRLAADLAEENAKLLPKANSFDAFMNSQGNLTIDEVAKTLNIKGIGRNKLFEILTIEKILFRKGNSYEAYQSYINRGYFVHKQNPVKKGDVIEQRTQVFVTPKGLDWLSKEMKKRNYVA